MTAIPNDRGSCIILIGFMGSGKTSVAKRISEKTKRPFIDTDEEIAKTAHMTIPCIFEKYGESYFRALERDVTARIGHLSGYAIATGGGIIKNEANIENLRRAGHIFYLQAPADKLYANITADQGQRRPLLNVPDQIKEIRTLLAEREPLYLQYSDYIVDASTLPIESIAEGIITLSNKEGL